MISIIQYLNESWGHIPRSLYIHKLVSTGRATEEGLAELKSLGILKNNKDVYLYSFLHPDSNIVISFVGSSMLKPDMTLKLWFASATPLRNMIYKGVAEGANIASFSGEKIASKSFKTTGFLFSGEQSIFKKVAEIPTKIISTSVPIPIPLVGVILYENYHIVCEKNKERLNTITIKRFKGFTLPQMFAKSNYVYIFNCKTT